MRIEAVSLDRVSLVEKGVTLLNQVSFQIYKGEVFGFLTINNQGEEDLIELFRRNIPLHYGYVKLNGVVVNHYQKSDGSLNDFVYVVDKDSKLIQEFTVADNFAVLTNKKTDYIVNDTKNVLLFQKAAKKANLDLTGNELVETLSTFEKYAIEIIRAVSSGAAFIVLRNISNYISQNDLVRMFHLIRIYTDEGISFGYFCNHHEEQFLISNKVSLWEDGNLLKILYPEDYLDTTMDNYSFDFNSLKETAEMSKDWVVRFDNFYTEKIKNLNLTVKAGECITILDHDNSVLDDIIRIFKGEMIAHSGNVMIDKVSLFDSKKSVAYIPEHPIDNLLFYDFSFLDNLMIELNRKAPTLWMRQRYRKSVITEYEPLFGELIHRSNLHGIRQSSLYHLIYQRIILFNPKVVLIMQPFSNADMYLRQDILNLIHTLKRKKIAVIILAINLSDSIFVSDRLVLISNGGVESVFESDEFEQLKGRVYHI